ncbi:MAG: hypothetical protein P1P63_01285 [Treponemataceae bacterium]
MKYNFSSMKFKEDIFYKIVKKKQLDNLAKAIGEDSPEGKEKLKESFYDRYTFVSRIEFENWCKIDIERLWDEFAINVLIYKTANKITVSKAYLCISEDSYYQSLVWIWGSPFYHKYFSFVEFIIKNLQRFCPSALRNFFKKHSNFILVPGGKPFKITFTTQNSKFFKKIIHSIASEKNTIAPAHRFHKWIISQRPVLKQEEKNK